VCAVTDPTEELDADKASRFARMLWYPHEPEYHAAICVRRELARLRAPAAVRLTASRQCSGWPPCGDADCSRCNDMRGWPERDPAAAAPSEAVAKLRGLLKAMTEMRHNLSRGDFGACLEVLDTLERELAEKTALAELVPLLDQRLKDCAVTIKGQDRKLRDLEARLAANPALELPTRDELARFLSQATEGDAWDTEPDDEYGKVFRNAWRKKANRILAFLAPKPPEGA
jgi:hypothetical protein